MAHDDDDDAEPVRRMRIARDPMRQTKTSLPPRRTPPQTSKSRSPQPTQESAQPPSPAQRRPASARQERPREETDPDHKVGYGRPPKHAWFRPGQSGNPKGRPKGARSLKTHLLNVLDEVVEINEHGRLRKMTKREVIARQTVQQAMKGNLKSLAVITTFDPTEHDLPKQEEPLTADEEAMLAHYLAIPDDEGDDK